MKPFDILTYHKEPHRAGSSGEMLFDPECPLCQQLALIDWLHSNNLLQHRSVAHSCPVCELLTLYYNLRCPH